MYRLDKDPQNIYPSGDLERRVLNPTQEEINEIMQTGQIPQTSAKKRPHPTVPATGVRIEPIDAFRRAHAFLKGRDSGVGKKADVPDERSFVKSRMQGLGTSINALRQDPLQVVEGDVSSLTTNLTAAVILSFAQPHERFTLRWRTRRYVVENREIVVQND